MVQNEKETAYRYRIKTHKDKVMTGKTQQKQGRDNNRDKTETGQTEERQVETEQIQGKNKDWTKTMQ